MRKPDFAEAKTIVQISFAVTAKLFSAIVFATRIVQFLFFLNPNACTAWFVSDLVGNPEDRFSRVAAHMLLQKKERNNEVNKYFYRSRLRDWLCFHLRGRCLAMYTAL